MAAPTSVADLDLSPPPGKTYFNTTREWREEFVYFLMVDRFHDGKARTPVAGPGRSLGFPAPDDFYGGTIKGISKPGEIVWSRIYVEGGGLHADIGRAKVVELPLEETERRWRITTPQWPVMHAVTYGVSRDQLMAKHKANHIQVAYGPDGPGANRALAAKAAMFQEMGIQVNICGTEHGL